MKVVIIGAGFAGLKLARSLNNKPNIEVLLVDRVNYHQFQPLFYQVATAGLDASNISFPLRKVFQGSKNVRLRLDEITGVDIARKLVQTPKGNIEYDILVLATGADTNFFNSTNLFRHTYPMKSTVEALQLRHKLIEVFEACTEATVEADKERLLTMVVVGGGPTGVEVSGTLAEIKTHILPRDYPEIDFKRMRIVLVEGGERVLSAMSEQSSRQAKQYLEELGVEVKLNALVKDYDGNKVTFGDGGSIDTATVVWAAGIKGNVPKGIDSQWVARGNRIRVNRFNQVEGSEEVFALGDLAYMETPRYPVGHPQVANVAINQAAVLAKNLMEMVKGNKPKYEFEYHDQGSMATVGRHKAVVDIPKPKLHFGGFFAWFIWMSLHLMLILGVKNRIQVFVNWVYKYFTYDQSLRLLFRHVDRKRELP